MNNAPSNLRYTESYDFLNNRSQALAVVFDSNRPIGFARQVIEKFPYVDVQKRPHAPGTIDLWGNSQRKQRYVIGIFAQSAVDPPGQRLEWFQKALGRIRDQLPQLRSVAFPRRAPKSKTCPYESLIREWARSLPSVDVELVNFLPRYERFTLGQGSPRKGRSEDTRV